MNTLTHLHTYTLKFIGLITILICFNATAWAQPLLPNPSTEWITTVNTQTSEFECYNSNIAVDDKNWALAILENSNLEIVSVGFQSEYYQNPTLPNGVLCTPQDDFIRKKPSMFKLSADGDLIWKHKFGNALGGQFTSVAEGANNIYFACGNRNIGKINDLGASHANPISKHINTLQFNGLACSSIFDEMGFTDLVYNNQSQKIIVAGYISIKDSFLLDAMSNNFNSNILCPKSSQTTNNCNVEYGNLPWDIVVYEFDTNLDLQKIYLLLKDGNSYVLVDLQSLLNANNKVDLSNTNYQFNLGLDRGLGLSISKNGANIDGYLLSGNVSNIQFFDPNKYEIADIAVLLSKIDINYNFEWQHLVTKQDIDGNPLTFNPVLSTTSDCVMNDASLYGAQAWQGMQDADGDYIFPVSVNFIDVPEVLDANGNYIPNFNCSNTEFNTFFRSSDIFLIGFNANNGQLINAEHISHFSAEDFNAEVLETAEGHYVINGSVSDNEVLPPSNYGNIENAGRLIFVDKAKFKNNNNQSSVIYDYVFLESAADLCTFSTDNTSDGGMVICSNNSSNFDDYAIHKICFGYNEGADYAGCCVENLNSTPIQTITSNTIISTSPILPSQGFVVKNGAKLTISNCTIKFAENARIVVEKGAKLLVNGATLTNACPQSFWEGIQVWGSMANNHPSFVHQNGNYSNHGLAFIRFGSVVENASNAVKTIKVDNYGLPNQAADIANSNGIIVAINSKFKNNVCSIVLNGNNEETISYAINTDIIIDKDYMVMSTTHPNNYNPDYQIYLKDVTGFKMTNVALDNQTATLLAPEGIRAYESTFGFLDGSINNFKRGIDAYHSGINAQKKPVFITNNTFTNNDRSIKLSGYIDNVTNVKEYANRTTNVAILIKNNTFNVPNTGINYNEFNSIVMDGNSDYIVTENEFTGNAPSSKGFSIVAKNSYNNETNYIQKNELQANDFISVLAQFDNESTQLLCNNFTTQATYGLLQVGAFAGSNCIAPIQGSCLNDLDVFLSQPETFPTGNLLANTNNGQHKQFQSFFANNFLYNYYPNEEPDVNYKPNNMDISAGPCVIAPLKTCDFTNDESNNNDDGNGCDARQLMQQILLIENLMIEDKALLTKYDRADVAIEIENANTVKELQKTILGFAAYLSDEELKAVVDHIGTISPYVLLPILNENRPLNENVIFYLNNHLTTLSLLYNNWLTNSFGYQLNNLQLTEGLSPRTQKEYEVLRKIKGQIIIIQNGGINECWRQANTQNPLLFVLQILSNNTTENKLWFQKQYVEFSIKANQYNRANQMLNILQLTNGIELANYIYLQQLKISFLQNENNIAELNEEDIEALQQIEEQENTSLNAVIARNILLHYNNLIQDYEGPNFEEQEHRVRNEDYLVKDFGSKRDIEQLYTIAPNPAFNKVTVKLNEKFMELPNSIEVQNIFGETLFQQKIEDNNSTIEIDISHITPGYYLVHIKTNDLVFSEKLIIIN